VVPSRVVPSRVVPVAMADDVSSLRRVLVDRGSAAGSPAATSAGPAKESSKLLSVVKSSPNVWND
jgi:hypothetical protein